jgi:hypothetical protein
MKKAALVLVLTVFAFVATTALAQGWFTLRAEVPIGFSVDGQHYSAGCYELRTISGSIIRLRNLKTGEAGFLRPINPDQSKTSAAAPVLRFAVSGKRAWLTSFSDGDGTTWQIPVASSDLEASRGEQPKTVIVALK